MKQWIKYLTCLILTLCIQLPVLAKSDEELLHMAFICGSPVFTVNGVQKSLAEGDDSVVPYLQDDRLMVPLRAFAENFGMEVQWDAENPDKVGLSIENLQIDFIVDSAIATKHNAVKLSMDSPVCRHNGITYMPLRALCDWLGLEITWDGNLRRASVRELTDLELFEMKPFVSYENDVEIGATMINHADVDMYMSGRYSYALKIYDDTGNLVYPKSDASKRGVGLPAGWPSFRVIPANSQINDALPFGWLQPGKYDAILQSSLLVRAYGYRDIRQLPEEGIAFSFTVPEE